MPDLPISSLNQSEVVVFQYLGADPLNEYLVGADYGTGIDTTVEATFSVRDGVTYITDVAVKKREDSRVWRSIQQFTTRTKQ